MNQIKIVKCPRCDKPVEWSESQAWRPFCSERCKLVDLGAWANETYRIPEKTPTATQDFPDQRPEDT